MVAPRLILATIRIGIRFQRLRAEPNGYIDATSQNYQPVGRTAATCSRDLHFGGPILKDRSLALSGSIRSGTTRSGLSITPLNSGVRSASALLSRVRRGCDSL